MTTSESLVLYVFAELLQSVRPIVFSCPFCFVSLSWCCPLLQVIKREGQGTCSGESFALSNQLVTSPYLVSA